MNKERDQKIPLFDIAFDCLSLFPVRRKGLAFIFAFSENRGAAPSSRRRRRSSTPHLYLRVPADINRKTVIPKVITVFVVRRKGLEPPTY